MSYSRGVNKPHVLQAVGMKPYPKPQHQTKHFGEVAKLLLRFLLRKNDQQTQQLVRGGGTRQTKEWRTKASSLSLPQDEPNRRAQAAHQGRPAEDDVPHQT